MEVFFFLLNIISFALLYIAVKYKLKRRHMEKCASIIPGPPTYPIVGNGFAFAHVRSVKDMWHTILLEDRNYGNIQKFWLGPKLLIVLSEPHHIETVMASHSALEKDQSCYKIFTMMKNSMFVSNGPQWKKMRRHVTKMLNPKLLENLHHVFIHRSEILVKKMGEQVGAGTVDISKLFALCTLDIICETHAGAETINEQEENRFQFPSHLASALNIAFQRVVKPQFYIDAIFNLTETGKRMRETTSKVTALSKEILVNRMKTLKERGEEIGDGNDYECYADLVLDVGTKKGFNLDELAEMNTDLLIAGSDTTAVTLSSMILFLAIHQECQDKVYEELVNIFGTSDRAPTLHELEDMTYLTMCFKETLRHIGPPGIMRKIGNDIKLDKYTLPAGSSAYLLFFKLHRDSRFWKRPYEFYPEHFLPEQVASRPKEAFVPFSSGPRGCPGKNYSNISIRTIMSTILRKYKFTSPLKMKNIRYKYSLLLEITPGYHVEVSPRV